MVRETTSRFFTNASMAEQECDFPIISGNDEFSRFYVRRSINENSIFASIKCIRNIYESVYIIMNYISFSIGLSKNKLSTKFLIPEARLKVYHCQVFKPAFLKIQVQYPWLTNGYFTSNKCTTF